MKVSIEWLREYVDLDASTEELVDVLPMLGMEVEGIEAGDLRPDVGVDAGDDLRRDDSGFEAVLFGQPVVLEDGVTRCADGALVEGVKLEHAEGPFDDLHARDRVRLFQGDIGDHIDGDAWSDLDEEDRLLGKGQKPGRHGLEEPGELGLKDVDVRERTEIDGQR